MTTAKQSVTRFHEATIDTGDFQLTRATFDGVVIGYETDSSCYVVESAEFGEVLVQAERLELREAN